MDYVKTDYAQAVITNILFIVSDSEATCSTSCSTNV